MQMATAARVVIATDLGSPPNQTQGARQEPMKFEIAHLAAQPDSLITLKARAVHLPRPTDEAFAWSYRPQRLRKREKKDQLTRPSPMKW